MHVPHSGNSNLAQRKETPEITVNDTSPLIFPKDENDIQKKTLVENILEKIKDMVVPMSSDNDSQQSAIQTGNKMSVADVSDVIGKTLKAKSADQFRDYLEIDHLGIVTALKPRAYLLTKKQISRLSSGIIKDLRHTNGSAPRDVPRPNREIVLNLICELEAELKNLSVATEDESNLLSSLIPPLKAHWLSHEIGSDVTVKKLTAARDALKKNSVFDSLSSKIDNLIAEASKRKLYIQKQDNIFGRKFETEFVFELIKSPPESVLTAAAHVGKFLKTSFIGKYKPDELAEKFMELADSLSGDIRPWHAEVPEIQRFIDDPCMETFVQLTANCEDTGYQIIKQSYLGTKITLLASMPWKMKADFNYTNVIVPQRSSTPSVIGGMVKRSPIFLNEFQKLLVTANKPDNTSAQEFLDCRNILRNLDEPLTANKFAEAMEKIEKRLSPSAVRDRATQLLAICKAKAPESLLELESTIITDEELSKLPGPGVEIVRAKTPSYGTSLPHHPPNSHPTYWKAGRSVQASVNLNLNSPTIFEQNMLSSDQSVVVGLSGTTNIMTALYLDMEQKFSKTGVPFSLTDALAGTMMFVVFDGGHSIPESLAAFQSMLTSVQTMERETKNLADKSDAATSSIPKSAAKTASKKIVDEYALSYDAIPDLFESADTRQKMREATLSAFDQTRDLFNQVHAERMDQ